MSKCVNCLKETNEKEVFCITCHEEVLECAKNQISDLEAKLAEKEFAHNSYFEKAEATMSFLQQQFNEKGKIEEQLGELKEQLAKEQKHISRLKNMNKSHDEAVGRLTEENNQLKQQLAEKDKEIEQLKKFDDLNKTFFDLFRSAFKEPNKVDDLFNTLKTMQERQDQDKISFAVKQLEKVKKFFLEEHRDEEMDTDYIITKDAGEIADYLLDQIKQLKGVK